MSRLYILLALVISCLASNYNQTLGQNLCKLCVSSYCRPLNVENWDCRPCTNSPIQLKPVKQFYNSTGDNLGFIGVSQAPKALILVFRGTLPWDIKNWIQDINFIKTSFPICNNNCEVHRGFLDAYKQISEQVIATTKSYISKYGISNIIVTGHSLGGALATHATIDLMYHGIKVTELYTYGSPRVGDSKFSAWFSTYFTGETNRITHGRDPVPHLPFHDWGFNHITHQIFYKSSVVKGYTSCSDSPTKQDPKCSNQFLTDVMVTDHLSYFGIDFAGIILACQ